MKLAVMQPYFFPYLGYFQLLDAVDRFVVLDDVTFIKGGWINRNRILMNGEPHLFTVPLRRAGSNRRIHDIGLAEGIWRMKLQKKIAAAYANAPHRDETLSLFEQVIDVPAESIGELALASLRAVAERLGLAVEFVPTARIYSNDHLKAQERILDICKQAGAQVYVNSPGGRALYHASDFAAAGIDLRFLESRPHAYKQSGHAFQPGLSILDVLMWIGVEGARELLSDYRLESAAEGAS